MAWLGWYGPTKFLQKLVFRTPLVAVPVLVSEIEQNYLHWPLVERAIYERWLAETDWGRLFARYQGEKT
jgi:hypothetical protein